MSATKRVLLVEDNEMNRDMLSRRLQRRGFEVGIAVDGREGVAMALTGEYDVVLMDMNLPEIDGWEAARQVRAGEKERRVAIIALTAHAMQGDRERALAAGCDEYDTKPVDFERLLDKIATVLGGAP